VKSLHIPDTSLELAIARAVEFLRNRQLPHGEFTTLLGADRTLSVTAFDSSPFITSFVLYALSHLDRYAVSDIVEKAVSFILSEMEFGGVWRYWTSRQHKHHRLPPDLDDTACISDALRRVGQPAPSNGWVFSCMRDSAGHFKTWILPRGNARLSPWFIIARTIGFCQARIRTINVPVPQDEDPRFKVMHINPDDVDPVVNANALLYIGENSDTAPAVQLVVDAVLNEHAKKSLYYEDSLALYYCSHSGVSPLLARTVGSAGGHRLPNT